jgi:hypothetical protein
VCPKLGSKNSILSNLPQEFLLTIEIDYSNSIPCAYGTKSEKLHTVSRMARMEEWCKIKKQATQLIHLVGLELLTVVVM